MEGKLRNNKHSASINSVMLAGGCWWFSITVRIGGKSSALLRELLDRKVVITFTMNNGAPVLHVQNVTETLSSGMLYYITCYVRLLDTGESLLNLVLWYRDSIGRRAVARSQ